jgi:hypothetical protein
MKITTQRKATERRIRRKVRYCIACHKRGLSPLEGDLSLINYHQSVNTLVGVF